MLWIALDSETKLIISHRVGDRNGINAHAFVSDLRARTDGRYQVTSDQYNAYVGAMREHFGQDVDFGQLRKIYGRLRTDSWYGGGEVIGAVPHVKIGRPDFKRISTSHVERTNLSVRMHLRRFTRLTNANSKTLANMKDAVALYVAFYGILPFFLRLIDQLIMVYCRHEANQIRVIWDNHQHSAVNPQIKRPKRWASAGRDSQESRKLQTQLAAQNATESKDSRREHNECAWFRSRSLSRSVDVECLGADGAQAALLRHRRPIVLIPHHVAAINSDSVLQGQPVGPG